MATSDRPSGLTALAVINFIFSGLEFLGVIALVITRFVFAKIAENPPSHMSEEEREQVNAVADLGWFDVSLVGFLGGLTGALLFLSAIGYLKRKRLLGRYLGNAYAIAAFGFTASSLTLLPKELTGGLSLAVIRSLFYPVFTLVLLNWVFRRDLVR